MWMRLDSDIGSVHCKSDRTCYGHVSHCPRPEITFTGFTLTRRRKMFYQQFYSWKQQTVLFMKQGHIHIHINHHDNQNMINICTLTFYVHKWSHDSGYQILSLISACISVSQNINVPADWRMFCASDILRNPVSLLWIAYADYNVRCPDICAF